MRVAYSDAILNLSMVSGVGVGVRERLAFKLRKLLEIGNLGNPGSQYANLFMTLIDIRKGKWQIKFEPSKLQGLHISHLIIPCSRIADRIQHLICNRP
jgi:hypothetical protein